MENRNEAARLDPPSDISYASSSIDPYWPGPGILAAFFSCLSKWSPFMVVLFEKLNYGLVLLSKESLGAIHA